MRALLIALLLTTTAHADYFYNPYVDKATWEALEPHFLPADHPAKEKIDAIFTNTRASLTPGTLEKAGFINPKPRRWTHVIVTRHPDIEGFIFKIYTDAQRHYSNQLEHVFWILRITGAQMIREMIADKGWGDTFKVPTKWIYPLPAEPSPSSAYHRKNFILVEEDMDLYASDENTEMWGGEHVTEELLGKVHEILSELGLKDCAKPDNIPFSRDGKVAFIDTQTFHSWPVDYKKMTPFLSKPMQVEWKRLIKSKPNKKQKQGLG